MENLTAASLLVEARRLAERMAEIGERLNFAADLEASKEGKTGLINLGRSVQAYVARLEKSLAKLEKDLNLSPAGDSRFDYNLDCSSARRERCCR